MCVSFPFFLLFSVQGFNPGRGACFYSITKAALDMVTKQYALELGPHSIRVNSVNPGLVNTDGVKKRPGYQEIGNAIQALTPLGRLCTEMECVYPIMYFLSDQASMVTGCLHVVDGGWLSRLPY